MFSFIDPHFVVTLFKGRVAASVAKEFQGCVYVAKT
jgi:hypothetical protein